MGIYFVRHGQTDWNLNDKMQGKADIPLNETGRKQARETKEKLKDITMHHVYCSPLSRARETAQIINENWGIEIIEDERIKERDFGTYEGKSGKCLNYHDLWMVSDQRPFEEAEDSKSFYKRVESFLDDIIHKAKDENVLIVAHGGVSIPYHCYFHGYDFDNLNEVMLGNCEVSHMNVDKEGQLQRG